MEQRNVEESYCLTTEALSKPGMRNLMVLMRREVEPVDL
jgi:hypothetical protein